MEEREAATRKRFRTACRPKGLGPTSRGKGLGVEAGSTTHNDDGGRRHGRSCRGGGSQAGRLHDESHERPESCRHSRVQGCCRRSVRMETKAERRCYTRRCRDLPTGSQSPLESSCCGLRRVCRLRWTASWASTSQHRSRAPTRSSTPTNRGVGPERVLIPTFLWSGRAASALGRAARRTASIRHPVSRLQCGSSRIPRPAGLWLWPPWVHGG